MTFRRMFAGPERKLLGWAIGLFLVGAVLMYQAARIEHSTETATSTSASTFLEHLGVAFIIGAVVILVIEVGLRKEILADVETIFKEQHETFHDDIIARIKASNNQQPSYFIHSFRERRIDYDDLILADVREAAPGDHIDVMGISLHAFFEERPGRHILASKIREGCHFRLLLLHPDSTLLPAIQNLSQGFGYPDLRSSLRATMRGHIGHIVTELEHDRDIKGSFEIRLHKDLFSSLYAYLSSRHVIVGLYPAHASGTDSPAFEIAHQGVQNTMRSHFECIWRESMTSVLTRFTRHHRTNNVSTLFA